MVRGLAILGVLWLVSADRPAVACKCTRSLCHLTRFTESDRNGRFVFDGLRVGDYKLSAYAAGYPMSPTLRAGPQAFHVDAKGCSLQVLLLPKEHGNP